MPECSLCYVKASLSHVPNCFIDGVERIFEINRNWENNSSFPSISKIIRLAKLIIVWLILIPGARRTLHWRIWVLSNPKACKIWYSLIRSRLIHQIWIDFLQISCHFEGSKSKIWNGPGHVWISAFIFSIKS